MLHRFLNSSIKKFCDIFRWQSDGSIQGKRLAVKVGQSVAVLCFDAVTKVLQGIAFRKDGSKLSNLESENFESENSMEVEEANEGEDGTKWNLEWLREQVNKIRIVTYRLGKKQE